jgi:hypothetical protein
VSKESKFKSFLTARKAEAERQVVEDTGAEPETGARKRGRPAGKRSDPKVVQVTAYIQKDTHTAVKIALLKEGKKRQFSELVEELLRDWISAQ